MERSYSRDDVAELGKTQKLAPRVRDFIGRPGFEHRQEVNAKTGRVEDVVTWKPHDGQGNLTRAAKEVMEAMSPFAKADTERFSKVQERVERETLVDEQGQTFYAEPHTIQGAVERNGFHSGSRLVGVLARDVNGDFCPGCDRLRAWCECRGES